MSLYRVTRSKTSNITHAGTRRGAYIYLQCGRTISEVDRRWTTQAVDTVAEMKAQTTCRRCM